LKFALDHAQVNQQRWSLPHDAAQPTITSDNTNTPPNAFFLQVEAPSLRGAMATTCPP
jgi:hypothetical protein